jgi:benzoate membrane transport protein
MLRIVGNDREPSIARITTPPQARAAFFLRAALFTGTDFMTDTMASRDLRHFSADISAQGAVQGLIVSLVGYASSVAILIKGLAAVGASETEIASGLMLVGFTKGIASIVLSLRSRMPVSVAWTTPGMALLATTGAVTGGFPTATGAFLLVGALIVLTAFWAPLARLIAAIPKALANAMLAGVLLKLCLAPFVAIREVPLVALTIFAVWLVMMRLARLWAVPAAVAVALCAILMQGGAANLGGFHLPSPVLVMPAFTIEALFGLALPLFIVTMASQNITGLAVLSTFGFRHAMREGLLVTGGLSLLTAPFGAPTINYAAITAALCAGPDAHADPARRYVAAVFSGVGYILFASLAAGAAALVLHASPVLIEAAAGLALIGAFGGAIKGASEDEAERLPALLTFFVTASGLSFFGIGGAFWGLVLGWGARMLFRFRILA